MKHLTCQNLAFALTLTTTAFNGCNAVAEAPCKLISIGTAKIAAIRDGRMLLLDDDRELRLAAIEAGDNSHELRLLVGERTLRMEQLGEPDRYGRLVAFAYADDAQQSLQLAMLERGMARV